jgi:hypothetical protein
MTSPTDGSTPAATPAQAQVVIHGRQIESLEALRRQACEAMHTDPGWHVTLDNGETITIPHPLFVDDDVNDRIRDASGNVGMAKAVLGEAGHAKLIAGGGRSGDVVLAWGAMSRGIADTVPAGAKGETAGSPTQSSS